MDQWLHVQVMCNRLRNINSIISLVCGMWQSLCYFTYLIPNVASCLENVAWRTTNLPTLANRRHHPKLCLASCQWTSKFPYSTHCTMKSVQISRNTSWKASNMHKSSFILHTITLWNSLPPSACTKLWQCQSLGSFILQLYYVMHFIPPNT